MSLLPPNATPMERELEANFAARVEALPVESPRDAWIPERCPEALLPWLAWALSVDRWDPDWTPGIKRAVIASAWADHQRKGTVGAVKRALEDVGAVYDLVENPAGDRFTLTIDVHNTLTTRSSVLRLREQIEAAMRASVHWDLIAEQGLCVELALASGAGAAGVVFLETRA